MTGEGGDRVTTGPTPAADAVLDGGTRACGELLIELKIALDRLAAGRVLKLISRDPGARTDLPVWCEMTRHRLLWCDDETYYIERRS